MKQKYDDVTYSKIELFAVQLPSSKSQNCSRTIGKAPVTHHLRPPATSSLPLATLLQPLATSLQTQALTNTWRLPATADCTHCSFGTTGLTLFMISFLI